MNPRTALVITSISAPNDVLKSFAAGCAKRDIPFYLIGDKASPPVFNLENCDFYNLERQSSLELGFARQVPQKHYARKNIGYLLAVANGAEIILESDDDNYPEESFWHDRESEVLTYPVKNAGWNNFYSYFTSEHIWPRGLPLEETLKEAKQLGDIRAEKKFCPVQQGLADLNPDVDAVYRLTRKLPLKFDRTALNVSVSLGTWCPFNSQNTTWFKEAFELLYLPSYCSFRMTDIWRSFIAVRICWENNWEVLFHAPTVWQERNAHNLVKDFSDEISGYLNNGRICKRLEQLSLKPGAAHIKENMIRCYEAFIEEKLVDEKELSLLDAWFNDLKKINDQKNNEPRRN